MCGLMEQYKACEKYKELGIHIRPDENNLFKCYYAFDGITGSIFDGGQYFGILDLPRDFPNSPPRIRIITPNGRFKPNVLLCFNLSHYHPGSWNRNCTLGELVRAIRAFMIDRDIGVGAINLLDLKIIDFRRDSRRFNNGNKEFKKVFPDLVIENNQIMRGQAAPKVVEWVGAGSKTQQPVVQSNTNNPTSKTPVYNTPVYNNPTNNQQVNVQQVNNQQLNNQQANNLTNQQGAQIKMKKRQKLAKFFQSFTKPKKPIKT